MKTIDDKQLIETYGGASLTGTLVDSFVGGVKFLFEVGKSLGFSLRRIVEGEVCPIQKNI